MLRRFANQECARQLLDFGQFVASRLLHEGVTRIAASLTYTTLLSLVPLVTVMLSAVAVFPVFADIRSSFEQFIFAYLLPEAASQIVHTYLTQFAESAGQLTSLGLATLLLTALLLMHTIETSFNHIWNVRRPRPMGQRFLIYWAILTLGPILTGSSLSLSSYLQRLSLAHSHWSGIGPLLLSLTPLVLTIGALVLLYATVANRFVPLRHAVLGGVLAGIVLELAKQGFGLYLLYFPNYRLIYGAFSSIPIFLVWIYLSWLIVLSGAVLTAALSQWQGRIWRGRPQSGQRFFYALLLLQLLQQSQAGGQALPLRQIRQHVPLAVDDLEEILLQLARIKLVVLSSQGWTLLQPLETVPLAELHRTFVLAPLSPAAPVLRGASWLHDIARQLDAAEAPVLQRPIAACLPASKVVRDAAPRASSQDSMANP